MSASCRRLAASAGPSSKRTTPTLGVIVSVRPVERLHRLGQPGTELLGALQGGVGVAHAGLERSELVAVQPAERESARHRLPQALGDGEQDLVSDRVAERVVHELEAIEVEAEERHASARCGGACRGPVGQPAMKLARLARPVSGSWRASQARRSMSCLRSVMSETEQTTAASLSSWSFERPGADRQPLVATVVVSDPEDDVRRRLAAIEGRWLSEARRARTCQRGRDGRRRPR